MTKYEARGQGELGNPQVPNSPHKCTAATHLELMVPAHVWALQLALPSWERRRAGSKRRLELVVV